MAAKPGDSSLSQQNTPSLPSSDQNPTPDPYESGSPTQELADSIIRQLGPAQKAGEMGRLGGYRIIRVLSQGGMGMIFEAEDERLERRVALKVIKPDQASSENARRRFLQEAKAVARIQHDHIVTIYQVDEDKGVLFLAMQLLQGESLEARLQRDNKLPPHEVIRIARESAEGLAAAHEHGVVHRDIKPSNIWLERVGGRDLPRVKILDFGLARNVSAGQAGLTQVGIVIGTPGYLSPEQARGLPLDFRCDLFSLGCVVHHMASGEGPFHGTDALSLLVALTVDPVAPLTELNPDIPSELADLVLSLLAKSPVDRPPSAIEVARRLKAMEQGAATHGADAATAQESTAEIRKRLERLNAAREAPRPEPAKPKEPPAKSQPKPEQAQHGLTWGDESLAESAALSVTPSAPAEETVAEPVTQKPEVRPGHCPKCDALLRQLGAKKYCLACGYDADNPEEEPVAAEPDLRIRVPAWVWALLGGCLAIILLTVFRENLMPGGSWMLLWFILIEASLGTLVYCIGHIWLVVLGIRHIKDLDLWKYLDPTTVWKNSVELYPRSRIPMCLGSWGATAFLCALVVFWINDFSFKTKIEKKGGATGLAATKTEEQSADDFADAGELGETAGGNADGKAKDVHVFDLDRDQLKIQPASAECVIVGYKLTPDGQAFQEIYLATRDANGELHFAGVVTQFSKSADMAASVKLLQQGKVLPPSQAPVQLPAMYQGASAPIWIAPDLVGGVDYAQKDAAGMLKDVVLRNVGAAKKKS